MAAAAAALAAILVNAQIGIANYLPKGKPM